MKMTLGDMIKAMVFGFTTGIIASIFMLSIGDNTDEVIYGASVPMTRFFVTIICSVACIVAEMVCNSSAREVGVDVIISWVVTHFSVGENFLNAADKATSIKNMILPIMLSVIIASIFSNPIQKVGVKVLDWIPFKKKEK